MRGRRALQDIGGQSRGDVCASMALLRGIECGNVAEPRARAAAARVEFRGIAEDVVHSSLSETSRIRSSTDRDCKFDGQSN